MNVIQQKLASCQFAGKLWLLPCERTEINEPETNTKIATLSLMGPLLGLPQGAVGQLDRSSLMNVSASTTQHAYLPEEYSSNQIFSKL